MTVRFLLICEGSSDAALIPHIRRLFVENGQDDPQGNAWHGSRPLSEKIREGLQHSSECDLLLIHRDADANQETHSAGPEKRYAEIDEAVRSSGFDGPCAGIVPVRMTESWLLLDEAAIRRVAGRPQSDATLRLPPPAQVENVSDPKERLEQALLEASGLGSRRMAKFRRDIPTLKHRLLQDLPVGGLLEQVPSWVRFRDDLLAALPSLTSP